MINHIDQSLHNLITLRFPTIFEGREVLVTVNPDKGHYGVHIDDILVAQVEFDENKYTWRVAKGDLHDPCLIDEIGERIEAKYN